MILEERYNEFKCMAERALEKRMDSGRTVNPALGGMGQRRSGAGKRIRPVLRWNSARLCGEGLGCAAAAVAVE
jgi:geranylgeranyl pyrophosphate synthase